VLEFRDGLGVEQELGGLGGGTWNCWLRSRT
jgi:hypothetical protein